jgi:hypothetical protein
MRGRRGVTETPEDAAMTDIEKTGDGQASGANPVSWRDVIKVHPACELFPPMSAEELLALGEDIWTSRLRVPVILLYPGKMRDHRKLRLPMKDALLIDGRNRLDAIELFREKWSRSLDDYEELGALERDPVKLKHSRHWRGSWRIPWG